MTRGPRTTASVKMTNEQEIMYAAFKSVDEDSREIARWRSREELMNEAFRHCEDLGVLRGERSIPYMDVAITQLIGQNALLEEIDMDSSSDSSSTFDSDSCSDVSMMETDDESDAVSRTVLNRERPLKLTEHFRKRLLEANEEYKKSKRAKPFRNSPPSNREADHIRHFVTSVTDGLKSKIVLRETRKERMAKKKGPEMVKARRSSGKWQRRDTRQRKTMKGKRLSAKRAGPHVPELANDRMDIDDDMDGCTPAFPVTSMHDGGEAENVLVRPAAISKTALLGIAMDVEVNSASVVPNLLHAGHRQTTHPSQSNGHLAPVFSPSPLRLSETLSASGPSHQRPGSIPPHIYAHPSMAAQSNSSSAGSGAAERTLFGTARDKSNAFAGPSAPSSRACYSKDRPRNGNENYAASSCPPSSASSLDSLFSTRDSSFDECHDDEDDSEDDSEDAESCFYSANEDWDVESVDRYDAVPVPTPPHTILSQSPPGSPGSNASSSDIVARLTLQQRYDELCATHAACPARLVVERAKVKVLEERLNELNSCLDAYENLGGYVLEKR